MYTSLSSEILPKLIQPHSRILAAVSGGPDSIAMSHILWRYINDNKELNISLIICHVNHKARPEADQEAELVGRLAVKWGIPFILHEFDSNKNALLFRQNFQEASRDWRYQRWLEDMREHGCDLLATAHHLGDQAETVLYRLMRGSGTAGLAGIYPSKENIIRPLLSVTKEDILKYCLEENLPYAVDSSNMKMLYDRNRIRLELLPYLERKYNHRIQEALGRTAEVLRWDEEYINSQVDRLWSKYCLVESEKQTGLSFEAWEQPEAILSRLLRRGASRVLGDPRGLEYKYIKLLIQEGNKAGWRQDLPGLRVETGKNGFFFFRRELRQEQNLPGILLDQKGLFLGKWSDFPEIGVKVGIWIVPPPNQKIIWMAELDEREYSSLQEPLVCRTRAAGDRMYFQGLGHKTIKKVFQENGVPAKARDTILLIAQGNLVIWIPGVCRSNSMLPADTSSSRVYCIVSGI